MCFIRLIKWYPFCHGLWFGKMDLFFLGEEKKGPDKFRLSCYLNLENLAHIFLT